MKARIVGLCVLLALGVAAAASFGLGGRDDEPAAHTRTGPAATTTVTRQTLVQAVTLTGRLSYGDPTPLSSTATGTVTWLPAPGTLVKRGGPLLRVDDRPVVLLYGAIPSYRDIAEPAKGADVRQLKRNLAALGYRGFSVDDDFTAATTAAVKRWQHDLKIPETGLVERGRIVYAATAVRIAKQLVRLGASASGDVLSYTGSTHVVSVPADASEAAWAAPGAKVTVTLPSGASIGGTVSSVTDAPSTTGDRATGQVITIVLADQGALGQLGEVEVGIRYVAKERKDVLTVPVPALLALAEGGYGLEVVDGPTSRVVAVTVGLFADGRVEVAGAGIREGTVVGVPA
jgi:peptidoglycan hydrolase-like protein with peptidoglycan-binding domain